MRAKHIAGSAVLGCAMLTMAPFAVSQDGMPPDPVTVQVQKCFQGTTDDRLGACEKAVSLPTNASLHAHLLTAQALWQEKERTGSGQPLLRMAVEADPHDTTSRLILGWYLDRSDRSRAAAEEYREVARLAEGSTENVELDAAVLEVVRQSQQELGPFFQILARGFERVSQPRIASAFYSAAILNWKDKSDEQVPAMYQAALKLSPSNLALHVGYADYLHEISREAPAGDNAALESLKLAAEHLTEAIRLSPDDDRVSFALARIRVQIGDLKGAISEFNEVLRLRPEHPQAEQELRLAVLASDGPGLETRPTTRPDSTEAISKLRECVRLNEMRGRMACNDAIKIGLSARNAAKAHLYLAEESSGKEALAQYRAATEADPSFALAFFRWGLRLLSDSMLGEAADSVGTLQEAATLEPRWCATHEILAEELERSGRTDEAVAELQKAIALEPDDELLRSRLERLQSGSPEQSWAQSPQRKRVSAPADASAPRTKAPTTRSGLLLALNERSYWLVRDGADVRLSGPIDGIVVPRKPAWWRVGVAKPPIEGTAGTAASTSSFEKVWALPLESAPPRQATKEAPCAGRGGTEERRYAIDWASSEYAGITQIFRAACTGDATLSGRNSYVLPIESLRRFSENPDGTKLPDLAGEPATAAMSEAAAIETMRIAAGLSPNRSGEKVSIDEDRWSLRRSKGRWVLVRPQESEGQTLYAAFDIPLEAPAKLVGHNEVSPAWDSIQEAVPDAIDAFTSPDQDLLVVLGRTHLCAFELSKGAIQKRLLRTPFPVNSQTIMALWVGGTSVDKWSQTLLPALRNASSRE